MRVFVSYAAEQRPLADRLSHALRNEGHTVFFDRDSLNAGEAYDGEIRRSILGSHIFVFLISPESLSGRYALSELDVIQKAAPAPGDRVLPIMVASTPVDALPGYLRALNVLYPKGDIVAESVNRIAEIAAARMRRRLLIVAAILAVIVAGTIGWLRSTRPSPKPPTKMALLRSLSLFREADQSSEIVAQLKAGDQLMISPTSKNPNWVSVQAGGIAAWAMAQDIVAQETGGPGTIALGLGYGYQGSFWELFFTSPQKEGRPPNKFGIDMRFVDAIGRVQKSLDIAVFELNSESITAAILDAHRRGVNVRVVTGQFGFEESGSTFGQLQHAGIPLVIRPNKTEFMHNKFAILDGTTVWTGSWNYTEAATYRNNENAISLEAQDIAGRYEAVFNQMFEKQLFGKERAAVAPVPQLRNGVLAMFSPEDPIIPELLKRIRDARRSIAIMAFSLTLDELAQAILGRSSTLAVQAVLEPRMARGSRAAKSLCGGKVELRFAVSPHFLHHDVIVIDDGLVITGSTNFVNRGMQVNDENIVFIPDPQMASKYRAEFARLWAKGNPPNPDFCRAEQ
jgi:hypothetical protein